MRMSSHLRSISVRWIWLGSDCTACSALYLYMHIYLSDILLLPLVLLNGGQLVQVRTQQLGSINVIVGIKFLICRVRSIITSSNR